ncbi:unnamed protein product [Cylindrotheca closterium]|uniref:Uncharacterized protein n=1 Tax=Cylindrotheca closterium TaxID=2856 RepID=A0AAD2G4Q4_9STRA|nr:unnamed protein product [Cylindrotheca closterium]
MTVDSDAANSRLVVFVGPHKSASSSIQEFFLRHAPSAHNGTGGKLIQNHHPSLANWTWPFIIRRRSYQPRKGFAPLVTEYEDPGWEKTIHETILNVWNSNDNQKQQIILGTEELDRFGKTPWSGRDGLAAIEKLITLLQPDSIDIVVNYRRPRSHQWISIWKQLTRREKKTPAYSEYLCRDNAQDMLWEYLNCVANPIGLAGALIEQFGDRATIHILDMDGISKKDLDVSHVFACRVLKDVPCSTDNEWVDGMPHPALLNQKFGNPGITQQQLDEMEWMFLQRDCSYFEDKSFLQNPNLKVHYGDTMLQPCSALATNGIPRSSFANTTILLKLLQAQIGCDGTTIEDVLRNVQPGVALKIMPGAKSSSIAEAQSNGGLRTLPTEIHPSNIEMSSDLTQDAMIRMQLYALLVGVAAFICLFLRRIKLKRNKSRRR